MVGPAYMYMALLHAMACSALTPIATTDDASPGAGYAASYTTVTPIANITAFVPAVVKRQSTPGTQLKFPTGLGIVEGPAVPWIVTSYSDESDKIHDAGLTGPTFASRDQGRHLFLSTQTCTHFV